jgi:DNA polymerase III alpha subunit (gram-positive type)
MWNEKKVCPKCKWSKAYDRDSPANEGFIKLVTLCPECNTKLKIEPYEPIT